MMSSSSAFCHCAGSMFTFLGVDQVCEVEQHSVMDTIAVLCAALSGITIAVIPPLRFTRCVSWPGAFSRIACDVSLAYVLSACELWCACVLCLCSLLLCRPNSPHHRDKLHEDRYHQITQSSHCINLLYAVGCYISVGSGELPAVEHP
jgi:hypothetical protein